MDAVATRPRRRWSLFAGVAAALLVLGLLVVPGALASAATPAPVAPAFPRQVASYSWWTSPSWMGAVDTASMIYQNGVGVELFDAPQSVVLDAGGVAYRRFDAAEHASIAADQGDPADTVLSADGTFVVVAGADGQGAVEVVSVDGSEQRSLPIGDGMSALPLSIGDGDRAAVLLVADGPMSPYSDFHFQVRGTLTTLDLDTGRVRQHPGLTATSAALAPDGSRIAATTADGVVVLDPSDGSVTPVALEDTRAHLDGDAWSPTGERFAVLSEAGLTVVDASGPAPSPRTLDLPELRYASVLGWRDEDTLLVQDSGDDNAARFLWIDADTGEAEQFASYAPGFTGAALGSADAARDLVAAWEVRSLPADRGPLSSALAAVLALAAGVLAWAITRRFTRPRRP